MKVLYFAQAARLTGLTEENWEGISHKMLTPDDFWNEAIRRHPRLQEIRGLCRLASGGSYVDPGMEIDPTKELAVIPPVSGG